MNSGLRLSGASPARNTMVTTCSAPDAAASAAGGITMWPLTVRTAVSAPFTVTDVRCDSPGAKSSTSGAAASVRVKRIVARPAIGSPGAPGMSNARSYFRLAMVFARSVASASEIPGSGSGGGGTAARQAAAVIMAATQSAARPMRMGGKSGPGYAFGGAV